MSTPKRRRIVQADDESDDEANSQLPFQPAQNQGEEDEGFDADNGDSEEEVDEVGGDGRRRAGRRRNDFDADDSGDYNPDDDEEDGEDLLDNAELDYQRISELDTYDASMLDSRQYSAMSVEQRKKAEEENARRMAREQGLEELLDDDGGEDDERREGRRGRFDRGRADIGIDGQEDEESDDDIEQDDELDLKALDQVQLREFLAQDKTRRIINKKFWKFVSTYIGNVDGGDGGGDGGGGPGGEDDEATRKRKKKWLKKQVSVR
jgi:hypothetical protein